MKVEMSTKGPVSTEPFVANLLWPIRGCRLMLAGIIFRFIRPFLSGKFVLIPRRKVRPALGWIPSTALPQNPLKAMKWINLIRFSFLMSNFLGSFYWRTICLEVMRQEGREITDDPGAGNSTQKGTTGSFLVSHKRRLFMWTISVCKAVAN